MGGMYLYSLSGILKKYICIPEKHPICYSCSLSCSSYLPVRTG